MRYDVTTHIDAAQRVIAGKNYMGVRNLARQINCTPSIAGRILFHLGWTKHAKRTWRRNK